MGRKELDQARVLWKQDTKLEGDSLEMISPAEMTFPAEITQAVDDNMINYFWRDKNAV